MPFAWILRDSGTHLFWPTRKLDPGEPQTNRASYLIPQFGVRLWENADHMSFWSWDGRAFRHHRSAATLGQWATQQERQRDAGIAPSGVRASGLLQWGGLNRPRIR